MRPLSSGGEGYKDGMSSLRGAGPGAAIGGGGLHPLLEINARHTMGFVALAVERSLQPSEPVFWSIK